MNFLIASILALPVDRALSALVICTSVGGDLIPFLMAADNLFNTNSVLLLMVLLASVSHKISIT